MDMMLPWTAIMYKLCYSDEDPTSLTVMPTLICTRPHKQCLPVILIPRPLSFTVLLGCVKKQAKVNSLKY